MFLQYSFVFLSLACLFMNAGANPVEIASNSFIMEGSAISSQTTVSSMTSSEGYPSCIEKNLETRHVRFLQNGELYVEMFNATLKPPHMRIDTNNLHICFKPTYDLNRELLSRCQKWMYDKSEFTVSPNGTVLLFGDLLENGTYGFNKDGKLFLCTYDDEEDYDNDGENPGIDPAPITDVDKASIYIGKIGSAISVLALIVHIVTFCLVPTLWNLPGYNLLSLSVAFLMAYSFVLIGQIPEVLGTFCVVSAILQQFFFLAAFFWMNVMAFDVWKTLKMATERLMVSTESARRRQFLWYSLYAWLGPLTITIASTIVDNTESVPDTFKPQYGRLDTCWLTNTIAKAIFFSFPAFTLFVINAVFFILSAIILKTSTMKETSNSHKQTAKLNFVLYVRLALMMGITWLIGAIAIMSNSTVIWFFFDIFNSLQGLFVFLLFTCSRKVFIHIRSRISVRHHKDSKESSNKTATDSVKMDTK